jgi:hypothetical protein
MKQYRVPLAIIVPSGRLHEQHVCGGAVEAWSETETERIGIAAGVFFWIRSPEKLVMFFHWVVGLSVCVILTGSCEGHSCGRPSGPT